MRVHAAPIVAVKADTRVQHFARPLALGGPKVRWYRRGDDARLMALVWFPEVLCR